MFADILNPGSERILRLQVGGCRVPHDIGSRKSVFLPFEATANHPSQHAWQFRLQLFSESSVALFDGNGHRKRNQVKATPNRFIHAPQAGLVITRNDQFENRSKFEEILAHEPGGYPIAASQRFDLALRPSSTLLGLDRRYK